ncbi:SusC/RagA family TonB-linked outer membrane protein [Pedobacter sp.]|jgi:TonB-linked SusC/RagA family outer membrane protein|uniref:SusC/RagA family TonB-linked outer membrane protein n=1 Tax=Pedobacter sp. TaxID=1411316 RepID=UPI002CE9AA26|nr:SusC/RagA family TonB-linked outer membrane protein [Pedobacter sp.]HWW42207.1 SusC/RagA family TonB-linked outer membrane protein [Pedobacter sp.]
MKKLLQSLFVFMLFAVSAMAQQRTITGTVTGKEDGLPLPGVSVKVKGTKTGTMTGSDGKFSISAESGAQIEFSSIGYLSHSRTVAAGNVINVALESDAKSLGEVIVTANAIKREKRTLGYSAPTIKNEELVQGGSPSVISSLAGKVAGINVTSSSSTPGSSSRVVLRGGSSISGSNQALIVVDGVPIDNSSVIGGSSVLASVDFGNRGNDLAPDDIASVTVLKGPAAAALYGSRASNGALVITTKTGSKGADKTSITFTTSNTFSNVLKLPDYQNEYGQGYIDEVSADGKSATYITDFKENGSWGAPFTGVVQPWGQEIDGVRQTKPYSAVKNNVKDFFTTGFATDNNLSFSGGGEKTTYFLGLNSLNSNGVFPGNYDQFNKYGVRFNGTSEFSNKFTAGVSFNYTRIDANEVGGGQGAGSVYNNVLQTPRDIDLPSLADLSNKYNGYGYTDAKGVKHPNSYGYYGTYTQNPYWILQNYKNLNDVSRVTGNFNIAYNPYSWLNIKERVGIDTYSDRRRTLAPKYSFVDIDNNPDGQYAGTNTRSSNGNYQIDQFNVTELVHDLMISASHKFNDDFEGSIMIGNNIRQRQTNSLSTGVNASGGLVVPGWYNLNNSNGPVNVLTDQLTKRRLVGLYADLNLSYKNFLFLEATARNDWSSTLPTNNNSFFYPSVSGSFVFTELLKNSSINNILSYGKLRSSWAQVGNDTDPYQLLTTFSKSTVNGSFGSTVFPFGNVAALTAGTTLGNINLKPEKTAAFEIGTELGFLDNRISVDFSYYKSNSKDQILTIPIPNSTGYGFSLVNAGEVQNKGVELSLRGTIVKSSDVTWEMYGSYTKNNNKVLSLMPGVDQISIGGFSGMTAVAAVGRPYGEFYAVTTLTDDQGRTVVDSKTGIPLSTPTAQYVGNYNPKYQASLGTNLRYKHVSLNVLFDTKQGGVFFSRTRDITAFAGVSAETGGQRIGAIFPNSVYKDASGKYVPNTSVGYIKQNYYGSEPAGADMVDGSFVKLRSASLSYTFTKEQLKRTPFGSFAIGVYGNNLFIWTPKSNQWADPEINSAGAGNLQGFDFTAQPSVRNYGINLKASF